jgi:large subunit ribosomal protein L21
MFAVVRTGGKQYRVQEGDLLKVEKLEGDIGSKIALEVLLVGEGDGVKVGAPLVDGARVEAEVVSHGKRPKVWRFRTQEEGWDRIRGHRQPYTELKITAVTS